jgi:formylglycine-generating enzyme required for sulfatase activity
MKHLTITIFLIAFAFPSLADDPPKLKTQSITLKLASLDAPVVNEQKLKDYAPKIELIQIPPGQITLKNEDGKEVTQEIKPIWIAKYEARWDEYEVFWPGFDLTRKERDAQRQDWKVWRATRVGSPYFPPWGEGGPVETPACCIHFQAARKYCAWLSKHTGKKFRLPTEAEWEYACRAGGPSLQPDPKTLDKFAWFKDNADGKNHSVGRKQPNAWGLYDMLGNVAEYVIRDSKDDKGLVAGGAWTSEAKDVHRGAREAYRPDWQKNDPQDPKSTDWTDYDRYDLGFRVVMED